MCSLRVLTVLTVALAASSAVAPAYAQEPVALTAWQIGKSGTRVVTSPIGDGLLLDGSRRGWLRSRDGAGDLILRLQFRLETSESEGAVIVRAATGRPDQWAERGYRITLRARADVDGADSPGRIQGISERVRDNAVPVALVLAPGEWHHLEVRCVGDLVTAIINGTTVHTAMGGEPADGVIGLEVTRGVLEFRAKELTPLLPRLPDGTVPVYPLPDAAEPPVLVEQRNPVFADEARARRASGTVRILTVITSEGRVFAPAILRSVDPALDAEALRAARRWRFKPARIDDQPVATGAILELEFVLHDGPVVPPPPPR